MRPGTSSPSATGLQGDETVAERLSGPRAKPAEVAWFAEQRAPQSWARAEALLATLQALGKGDTSPPRTRVHPLPVYDGFDAFYERAWGT